MAKLISFTGLLVVVWGFLNLLLGFAAHSFINEGEPKWISWSHLDGARSGSTGTAAHAVVAGAKRIRGPRLDIKRKASTVSTDHAVTAPKGVDGSAFTRLGPPRRFPTFGTEEFAKQCGWTLRDKFKSRNCTLLAQPCPNEHEGFSNTMARVVAGHIVAQQAGCKLIVDLGPNIDTDSILTPFPNSDSAHPSIDWRNPPGRKTNWTTCRNDPQCFPARPVFQENQFLREIQDVLGGEKNLSGTPSYRFAYSNSPYQFIHRSPGPPSGLQLALPGFQVETGVACSLGSLFHLSPSVSQFEPQLFTKILPTLHAKDALVMSLYIRTHQADVSATAEEKGNGTAAEDEERYQRAAGGVVSCALHVEKDQLEKGEFSQVVWMVLTDSQYAKNWVKNKYDTRFATGTSTIEREVLTTGSRGAHTRTRRNPSTTDVAEALIDWYLIGESDLAVISGQSPSFGTMGALRTARPVYKGAHSGKASTCRKSVMMHYKVDINSASMDDYKQFNIDPPLTTKIISNAPYQRVEDIYKIKNLSEHDRKILKFYEQEFVVLQRT